MAEQLMPPEAASMPVPPEELITRVAGGPNPGPFFWSGRESVRELERTLAIAGRSLDSFDSILDFGCGCGRMLLWMEGVGKTSSLSGTDIDPEAIDWCRAHIPYARVGVNDADPPLPYPAASFDLVYNHSVFTHIDERRQDLWLTELQRVTRPGGLIVLSVHGVVAVSQADWSIRDRVEREGIVFVEGSLPKDFPLPDWYQNTFHAPWYVFEHWGRFFEIRAYVPGGALAFQDHVLLERTADGVNPTQPISARPALPADDAPADRVAVALASARTYRDSATGSRFGAAGRLARSLALRAIRPYSAHEDRFDQAVATSIAELTRAVAHQTGRVEALERRLRDDLPAAQRNGDEPGG